MSAAKNTMIIPSGDGGDHGFERGPPIQAEGSVSRAENSSLASWKAHTMLGGN
jgi:hypothetical protein